MLAPTTTDTAPGPPGQRVSEHHISTTSSPRRTSGSQVIYERFGEGAQQSFDLLKSLVRLLLGVSNAALIFTDEDEAGATGETGETAVPQGLETYVLTSGLELVVEDASADERFRDDPLMVGSSKVKFYVGVPLRRADGVVIGSLAGMDARAGTVTQAQRDALVLLAAQVVERVTEAESLATLRDFVENVNVPMHAVSAEGVIVWTNQAELDLLGYSAEEYVGRPISEFHADPHVIEDILSRLLRKELLKGQEARLKARDGSIRIVLIDSSVYTVCGMFVHTRCVSRDVTGEREAAAALARQHEELAVQAARIDAIIGTLVDGIVTVDTLGTIRSMNPAAERIFGYTAADLKGQSISVLVGEPHVAQLAAAISGDFEGQVLGALGVSYEINGVRSDGSLVPLEAAVSEMVVAGERLFNGIVRDISERKALEREHTEFKTTLDQTDDSIFMFDPDTMRFLYANEGAVRHTGYARAELLTMTPLDLKPDFNAAHYRHLLGPLIRGEKAVEVFETVHRRKDGREVPVEILLQYLAPRGQPPRFINIARDITERRRIDKLKSEFVSTVSHELRTPLTSIRGALGLVVSGLTGELSPEAREYLEIAVANSERLGRLVNDILDIEKMESGSMELRQQLVELEPLVRQAVNVNTAFAALHDVSIVVTGALPRAELLVDEDRLVQVLTNLLSNAVKFSPEGERVDLSATLHGHTVRLDVRDRGPGVPVEFQSRIFQRFAQADASNTRQRGGSGLGLSITKGLVEAMQGRVGFECAPGGGSTFYVELPCLPLRLEPEAGTPARILLCKGDLAGAHGLAAQLAEGGVVADLAPTAERARQRLSATPYERVVLDLDLAGGAAGPFLACMGSAGLVRAPVAIIDAGAGERSHMDGSPTAILVADLVAGPLDPARLTRAALARGAADQPRRALHIESDLLPSATVRDALPEGWLLLSTREVAAARGHLAELAFDLVVLDLSTRDLGVASLLGQLERAPVFLYTGPLPSRAAIEPLALALRYKEVRGLHLDDALRFV